ncbi:MAG: hypothetical protein U0525_04675 [Patescibacteria group bacterium]
MFTQPPDLLEYRRNVMPWIKGVDVYELDPPANIKKRGFPTGSIINSLFGELRTNSDLKDKIGDKYFMTLFPTSEMNSEALKFGLRKILLHDSLIVNSKSVFLQSSAKYGYKVCEFLIIRNESELINVVKFADSSKNGVWIKAEGSGSDLVAHIESTDISKIHNAWTGIRSKIVNCLQNSDFHENQISKLIDKQTIFPIGGLVVEKDISNYSDEVYNCAAMLTIDVKGIGNCMGIYNQNPNIDPFCGTNKMEFDPIYQKLLAKYQITHEAIYSIFLKEIEKIYKFMFDHKFVGVFGVDFFLVFKSDSVEVFFTEINARLTNNSGINVAYAINSGSYHHMPINAVFPSCVNTISDLRKYCTIDGVDYLDSDPKTLAIVPQAFSSIWAKNGGYRLIEKNNLVRLLILGNDHEKISELTKKLGSKGVNFK